MNSHRRHFLIVIISLLTPLLCAQTEKEPPAVNTAVGLGGGVGGKFGGRGHGQERLQRMVPSMAKAIGAGLGWLASRQAEDGSWAAGPELGQLGVSATCLLTFLGDGSTLRSGSHRDTVKKAAKWLRERQQPDGSFQGAGAASPILEHALATFALTEACGLSQTRLLQKNVRSAVAHLLAQQRDDGGWNHATADGPADAFTTCHAVFAARAAADFEIVDTEAALARVSAWIDAVTAEDGGAPVSTAPVAAGAKPDETAVAAVLLMRFFLGQSPRETPAMKVAAERICEFAPSRKDVRKKTADPVFWYLGSYGMYQYGTYPWRDWANGLIPTVPRLQQKKGENAGSWDPLGAAVEAGGREYATALAVLSLEVYYRYTRLVR